MAAADATPAPQRALNASAHAWLALACLALAACTSAPMRESGPVESEPASPLVKDSAPAPADIPPDVAETPDAVPKEEPKSATGNPVSYIALGKRYEVLPDAGGYHQRGYASWYGKKFQGHRTSSGERYDMFKMTAAHRTLPIPCYARVTNLLNGKSVIVRVNDRGPFHSGRIIDLSYAAAARLDMIARGEAPVDVAVIDPSQPAPDPAPIVASAKPAAPAKPPSVAANATANATAAAGVSKPTPPALTVAETISSPPAAAGATVPGGASVAANAAAALPADPAAAAADAAGGGDIRYLQAGSFDDPINAATLREHLKSLGVSHVQLRSEPHGKSFIYRVLVGPFLDAAALETTRLFLANKSLSSFPVGLATAGN
jgi:rare lipoprotein A